MTNKINDKQWTPEQMREFALEARPPLNPRRLPPLIEGGKKPGEA